MKQMIILFILTFIATTLWAEESLLENDVSEEEMERLDEMQEYESPINHQQMQEEGEEVLEAQEDEQFSE
jgi:hypothetical protein